jgi:hypothetical protein
VAGASRPGAPRGWSNRRMWPWARGWRWSKGARADAR